MSLVVEYISFSLCFWFCTYYTFLLLLHHQWILHKKRNFLHIRSVFKSMTWYNLKQLDLKKLCGKIGANLVSNDGACMEIVFVEDCGNMWLYAGLFVYKLINHCQYDYSMMYNLSRVFCLLFAFSTVSFIKEVTLFW